MSTPSNAVKVTVSNPTTGEVLEERVVKDNYIVICAGNRYVHYTQVMGKTHMLCIKTTPETSHA